MAKGKQDPKVKELEEKAVKAQMDVSMLGFELGGHVSSCQKLLGAIASGAGKNEECYGRYDGQGCGPKRLRLGFSLRKVREGGSNVRLPTMEQHLSDIRAYYGPGDEAPATLPAAPEGGAA